jgi:hypothetical protein
MYVDDVLAGCITYGIPPSVTTQRPCGDKYRKNTIELNRLFIFDWAGHNSESWLIGQSFRILHSTFPDYFILISFADTGKDHYGFIYQATNWLYTGLSDKSGCYSRIEINGREHSQKFFYNLFGTQSKKVIKEHYPDAIFHPYTQKHRYIYFLGTRRERKELRKALKWSSLPYPKGS